MRPDIIADNGVIHILDSIISPASSGLTIAQYIETPEDQSLSFRSVLVTRWFVVFFCIVSDIISSLRMLCEPILALLRV